MIVKKNIKGFDLVLETTQKCFSPANIDAGTLAMVSCVEFSQEQKVLMIHEFDGYFVFEAQKRNKNYGKVR